MTLLLEQTFMLRSIVTSSQLFIRLVELLLIQSQFKRCLNKSSSMDLKLLEQWVLFKWSNNYSFSKKSRPIAKQRGIETTMAKIPQSLPPICFSISILSNENDCLNKIVATYICSFISTVSCIEGFTNLQQFQLELLSQLTNERFMAFSVRAFGF